MKLQLEDIPYFQSLKQKMNPKQYSALIQGFQEHYNLLTLSKDTYVFKHRMRLDKFYILDKGKCLAMIPKSNENLIKESNELQQKYPGVLNLPQNFYWNLDKQRLYLVYKGVEQYPKEHLQYLSQQITKLDIPYPILTFVMPHLFENHVVKFKETHIIREQQALIENCSKKACMSLVTLEECQFLTIDYQLYEDLVDAQKKKQREQIENMLFQAFDEGIKINSGFKRILQEIQNNSQVLKVLNHCNLYTPNHFSQNVYLIIKGEFQLSYRLTQSEIIRSIEDESQYQKFKRYIRTEREPINAVRNQIFVTPEIQELLKTRRKILHNKEFQLLKLGQGQIIGDEEFTFDCFNNMYHTFKCQCISTNAKVLAIKKSDLYKICVIHDWFSKLFHKRCEFKRNWLQSRFQIQYLQDLKGPQKFITKSSYFSNTDKTEEAFILRLQLLEEEAAKRKTTKIFGSSTSPPKKDNLTSRFSQRKLQVQQIILKKKPSKQPINQDTQIGMMDYFVKLDRHKQMLLQHQIRKAVENNTVQMQTEMESIKLSPEPFKRSQSYRIHRSSSLIPSLQLPP